MKDYRRMGFGEFVRNKRTFLGLTLDDVSKAVGCSIPYLSEMERGTRNPLSGMKLVRLAKVLQVSKTALKTVVAIDRGYFLLGSKGISEDKFYLGVQLMEEWDLLDDEMVGRLSEVLDGKVNNDSNRENEGS